MFKCNFSLNFAAPPLKLNIEVKTSNIVEDTICELEDFLNHYSTTAEKDNKNSHLNGYGIKSPYHEDIMISSFESEAIQYVVQNFRYKYSIGHLYNRGKGQINENDISQGFYRENVTPNFHEFEKTMLQKLDNGSSPSAVSSDGPVSYSVNLCVESATEDIVQQARDAGKKIMFWFPCTSRPGFEDCVDSLQNALQLKPDVICTNRPDILATILNRSKIYK